MGERGGHPVIAVPNMRLPMLAALLLGGAAGLLQPSVLHRPCVPNLAPPRRAAAARLAATAPALEALAPSASPELCTALGAMFEACAEVAGAVRTASCDSTSCYTNLPRGPDEDAEIAVDLLAEDLIATRLRACGAISLLSSAEDRTMHALHGAGSAPAARAGREPLAVCVDALGGASIDSLATVAVGTLFSVWKSESFSGAPSDLRVSGREALAAGACSYGARTSLYLAIAGESCVREWVLHDGTWTEANVFETLVEGRLCSPANVQAYATNERYAALVRYWLEKRYRLLLTGALVADVLKILITGFGVYTSAAASTGARPVPLLLYEAIPLALLIEACDGTSSDGAASSLLDVLLTTLDQRSQVAVGSPAEVARFVKMVGPAEPA